MRVRVQGERVRGVGAMSDGEDEDPRVATLVEFAAMHTGSDGAWSGGPSTFAERLDALGVDGAVAYGGILAAKGLARAHFAAMALLDEDAEGGVAASVKQRRVPLKGVVASGGQDAAVHLLAAVEAFVCVECEGEVKQAEVAAFGKTLKALWEWDVVAEDAVQAWVSDENAARQLTVQVGDARRLREAGQAFLDWVQEGGSDEDDA